MPACIVWFSKIVRTKILSPRHFSSAEHLRDTTDSNESEAKAVLTGVYENDIARAKAIIENYEKRLVDMGNLFSMNERFRKILLDLAGDIGLKIAKMKHATDLKNEDEV